LLVFDRSEELVSLGQSVVWEICGQKMHEVVVLDRCVLCVILDVRQKSRNFRADAFKGIASEISVDLGLVVYGLGTLAVAVNCNLVCVAASMDLCVLVELVKTLQNESRLGDAP